MPECGNVDEDAQILQNSPLLPPSIPVTVPPPLSYEPPPPNPAAPDISALGFTTVAAARSNSDASSEGVAAAAAPPPSAMMATQMAPCRPDDALRLPCILGNLTETAKAALGKANRRSSSSLHADDTHTATRVDSVQEGVEHISLDKNLKIRTQSISHPDEPLASHEGALVQSPLSRHMIKREDSSSDRQLPMVSPSPASAITSPRSQQLPSIRHLTGPLDELAEAATQQDMRAGQGRNSPPEHYQHHPQQQQQQQPPQPHRQHSHSLSSATSQSPMPFFSSYAASSNHASSPGGHSYTYSRSPSTIVGDHIPSHQQQPRHHHQSQQHHHQSQQPTFSHVNYNSAATPSDRRASSATEFSRNPYASSLHSLRTLSSSGGDSGPPTVASTSTEGSHSTAHTTPSDHGGPSAGGNPMENPGSSGGGSGSGSSSHHASRQLPIVAGMPPTFQCDHEGCSASFQTQYLLSSHKNVHSSVRTHFCSVAGCSRAVGGQGFKRKNEMIRHGLVHKSPGYICPFCPDMERKYPRPDNLQRHVRVHHHDRDRDDPLLREVLAQRTEGAIRANRRRRTVGGPVTGP